MTSKDQTWTKIELILRHWNAWKEGRKMDRNLKTMFEWPTRILGG